MDDEIRQNLRPGARVRVIQQIAARDYTWTSEIRGTVMEYEQRPTGSWYAHSKNDKLWLDRLLLRKEDGELTTLNLDEFSHIEVLSEPSPATEAAVAASPAKSNESNLPM